jgi:hypothetical protein
MAENEEYSSAMNRGTRHLPFWALAFLILSACATSPEEEARKERKRVEKENSRALVFGGTVKVVPIKTNGFGQLQDVPGFEGVPGDLVFSRDGR